MSLLTMTKIAMKSLFSKPATRLYPFEKRENFAAARGKITIDIAGCIYCGICKTKCPTQAIEVDRENKKWTIDRLRCITCNYCVDVCPKKCLKMDNQYSATTTTKEKESF